MAEEATPPASGAKSKQKRSQLLHVDTVNRSVATQQNTTVLTLGNIFKQSRAKKVNQFSEEEKKASKEKREQERGKDKENITFIEEIFKREWQAGLEPLGCDETTATSAKKKYDRQMRAAVTHLQDSTKAVKEPEYMFTGKESYFDYLEDDGNWKFDGYGGLLTKTKVRNYLSDDVREPTLCAIEYVLTRPDKHCLKASSSPKWGAPGHCRCKCFIHLKEVLIVLCKEAYNEGTKTVDKQLVPEVVVKYMENPVRFMLGMRTLSDRNARRDPDKFFRFLLQNVVVQNNEAAMGKQALVFQFPFFQEKEIGVGVLGGMRFCKGMLAEMCGSRVPNTLTYTGVAADKRKIKKPPSDVTGTLAFNDLCNIFKIFDFSRTNFNALSVNARKEMVAPANRRRQIWRKVALRDLHCRLSANAEVLKSIKDAKIAEGLTEMCEEVTADKAYKHFQETSKTFLRETIFHEIYHRIVGAIVAKGQDATQFKKAYVIADHNVCYDFDEDLLKRRPGLLELRRWIPREPRKPKAKTETETETANGEGKVDKNESIDIDVHKCVKERIATLKQLMSENPNLLQHAGAVAVTSKVPTVSHVSSSITPKIKDGDGKGIGFHRFGLLGVVFPCKDEPFWESKDVPRLNHHFDCCALKVPKSTPLLTMCNGILSNSVGPKCLLRREFRRQNGNDNIFFVREGQSTEEFLQGSAIEHWTSDDHRKRAAESLETTIGTWATAHGGEQDDKVSVRWFVTAVAPDLRSRTQEAPRLQLPISVLREQEAKGNKVAVGLLPLAPQGHVCRYYPGPFILPHNDALTIKYWEEQKPNPWLGSFVHVRFGSILMGPATMLMSDGLHTTNGITPFAVALVIVGKEATIDSTIDSQRLTLDCYFNCLGPIMPTTLDRNRVAQLEKKIRESTFKYNKAMDLPTVVSISPANENLVHASLTPIRSVYLLTHFGPIMCYGGLENWENTDYQVRKEDITQDPTRDLKISKRDKKAAELNSQAKTKPLPENLDEADFSYSKIAVYNFKKNYDEPVKGSDDDSEWSGEDDGSQASSDYEEIPQEPKKRRAGRKKARAGRKKAPEASDSADEEE